METRENTTYRIIYSPDKTEGGAINTYTVEVEDDLLTAGKKTGFVGKVYERENEYRSFRFDRILSIEKVDDPAVVEERLRRLVAQCEPAPKPRPKMRLWAKR